MFYYTDHLLHIRFDRRRKSPTATTRSSVEDPLRTIPTAVSAAAPMHPAGLHLLFDVFPMNDLPRQQNLAVTNTSEARDRTALIDPDHHLLDVLLTVPEELDCERAPVLDTSPAVPEQFTRLGWLAGHQAMAILIDHIHHTHHSFKLSFRK
ncbi:hypothetical protein KDAU_73070 [Dictyobacter aurantiacus]|uniref:Uncharacterized protein n=1 Tax=Dictyobacter aurantiacus TaxID=1936993 RepID=A0A401ZST6_9CHLR|nr:hypothetical protein KDAU_73070 [Dictyobacter aurantiacus]